MSTIQDVNVATIARFLTIPFEKGQLDQQLQLETNDFLALFNRLPEIAAGILGKPDFCVKLIVLYFLRNLVLFYSRDWLRKTFECPEQKGDVGDVSKENKKGKTMVSFLYLIFEVFKSIIIGAFSLILTYPIDVFILFMLRSGDVSSDVLSVWSDFKADSSTIYSGFVTSLIAIAVHRTVLYSVNALMGTSDIRGLIPSGIAGFVRYPIDTIRRHEIVSGIRSECSNLDSWESLWNGVSMNILRVFVRTILFYILDRDDVKVH